MVFPLSHPTRQPAFQTNGLLGLAQILVWGGSFFLMAVLAGPVIADTHWAQAWVYGSLSISLLIAGLLAPLMGKLVVGQYGNTLLRYSGFVVGLGLLIVGMAPVLWMFILGWCIIGLGMGMGLFDTLFAVLGNYYGTNAKPAFTHITLISGFCTTLTWPFLAWMITHWGWRSACQAYALLLWLTVWPLYILALPGPASDRALPTVQRPPKPSPGDRGMVRLLGINFTLAAIIMAALSVQLITLLLTKGFTSTTAIGIAALMGPCQVGVRLVDLIAPKKHPIWHTAISTTLTLLGVACLIGPEAFVIAGVVLYSLGNGLRSIIRATLPLALFDPVMYPVVVGRLARPTLIAQALTPLVCGLLVEYQGTESLLIFLAVLALLNVGITTLIGYRLNGAGLSRISKPIDS